VLKGPVPEALFPLSSRGGWHPPSGRSQFHHLDPAQKAFALSVRGLVYSIDALREEARKCVLLCSNCHAEVEAGVTMLSAA
jgi:hypothetical protein